MDFTRTDEHDAIREGIQRICADFPDEYWAEVDEAQVARSLQILVHPLGDAHAARRCLSRHGLPKMERLTQLQMADFGGEDADPELEAWLALLRTIAQREGELTLKTLAVSGRDLMALGMAPGPALGQTLNGLLARVLAGELPNERQALLDSVFGKEM